MPATRTHQQRRDSLVELVALAFGTDEFNRAAHSIADVDLSIESGMPGRSMRVLEVSHVATGAGVQSIDHHLTVHQPGDLDPPILQVSGHRIDPPIALAHALGLREKLRQFAAIDCQLANFTLAQQLQAARIELSLQLDEETQGLWRENIVLTLAWDKGHFQAVVCSNGGHIGCYVCKPSFVDHKIGSFNTVY